MVNENHEILIESELKNLTNRFPQINKNEILYHMLSLIFYRYLSEKIEEENNKTSLKNMTFNTIEDIENFSKNIKEEQLKEYGYNINSPYLFKDICESLTNLSFNINDLETGMNNINNLENESFQEIFSLIPISDKISEIGEENTYKYFITIITCIEKINNEDLVAAFEYLLPNGDYNHYYISYLNGQHHYYLNNYFRKMTKILNNKKSLKVLDCECGYGSLLIDISKDYDYIDLYGLTSNKVYWNLSRMNLLIHDINYKNIHINYNDTLSRALEFTSEKFNHIIYNSKIKTFKNNWIDDLNKSLHSDESYNQIQKLDNEIEELRNKIQSYEEENENQDILKEMSREYNEKRYERNRIVHGIPLKSKYRKIFNDIDNISELLEYLKDDGNIISFVSDRYLYVGSFKKERMKLIEENSLDSIMTLYNLKFSSALNYVFLILKKSRQVNDVFFINTKNIEKKEKTDYYIPSSKIFEIYNQRKDIDKISYKTSLQEIKKNKYNLNISRYLDTFNKDPVKLDEIMNHLDKNNRKIEEIDSKIFESANKLGINLDLMKKNKTIQKKLI